MALWGKVLLLFVVLDASIVFGDWLWRVPKEFYATIDPRWAQAHQICSRLHELTRTPSKPRRVVVAGSSLVNFDVDASVVEHELADPHAEFVKLAMDGAPASDIERVARFVVRAQPALLIYVTAARDYPRKGQFDATTTPLARVLYPPDQWMPERRGKTAETFFTDLLRSYWQLLRYRSFVRLRVVWEARRVARALGLRQLGPRLVSRQGQTPEDADRQIPFDQFRGDQSNSLELYVKWLGEVKGANAARYLLSQETINDANYGLADNEQVASLRSLVRVCADAHVPLLLIYAPVNPIAMGGTPYYDASLANGYVGLFQQLAVQTGGQALDWRRERQVEEFVDFNHLNARGRDKFSHQLGGVIRDALRETDGRQAAAAAGREG